MICEGPMCDRRQDDMEGGRILQDSVASWVQASSVVNVRRLMISVSSGIGAPAAWKSHFTARGWQAMILRGSPARPANRGSRRADISQRSATLSKAWPFAQRWRNNRAGGQGIQTWKTLQHDGRRRATFHGLERSRKGKPDFKVERVGPVRFHCRNHPPRSLAAPPRSPIGRSRW